MQVALSYRPPYDWPALSQFLAARAAPGVELADGQRYARTFEGGHFEVTPRDGFFEATITNATPATTARLRRLLDLDADPAAISAHLGRDPLLRPLVAARPGLRLPGAWDGFELAVRAILGQQVTVAAATRLAGQLVAAFGRRYDGPPGLTHLFPTPEQLCDADIGGMPKARAAAIRTLAAAALNDPALFDPDQDSAAAIARFRALRGIGEWTAQYIAMRALHASDAFPTGDVALLRALAVDGVRPTARELERRADAWRPFRAYAVMHLWAV